MKRFHKFLCVTAISVLASLALPMVCKARELTHATGCNTKRCGNPILKSEGDLSSSLHTWENEGGASHDPDAIKYVVDEKVRTRLDNDFSYHAPHGNQVQRYEEIREKCHETAIFIAERCPPSRELSLALTALETVSMEANAAIARNERPPQLG